jgi:Na+/H+ antiporter 1
VRRCTATAAGLGGGHRRRHDRRIGFTVALLVATLAFERRQLEEAKVGILSAALAAALITWLLFRAAALLPRRLRIRALLGTA